MQPRAGIFWSAGTTISGTVQRAASPTVGITDGANSYVSGFAVLDGQPSPGVCRRIAAALLTFDAPPGNPLAEANLAGWNSSTLTLSWSLNDGAARQIHYLLMGGSDLSAKALSFLTTTTLGSFPITGVGFRPDVIVSIYAAQANTGLPSYSSAAHPHLSVAAAGVEWTLGLNVQSMFSNRYLVPSALYITQTGAAQLDARLASLDSDGFTFNVVRSAAPARIMTLALAGPGLAAGLATTPPVGTQVTAGLLFSPQAVLLATTFAPSSTTPVTDARISIGAATSTTSAIMAMRDLSGVIPTSTTSLDGTGSLLTDPEATPPSTARLQMFSSDGFALEWTGSATAPISFGYLAIGVGDAGALDGGSPDAGAPDAGAGMHDGGEPSPSRQLHVGCGCTASPAELGLALISVLVARTRRRTAGSGLPASPGLTEPRHQR
ncbi:MAG: hypothetical protein IPJ65_16355 [Archangiaceae bacterium]|nr:hypothetical protein [Archangiaceae bacterium]